MISVSIYNAFGPVIEDVEVDAYDNLEALRAVMHEQGFYRHYQMQIKKLLDFDDYVIDLISVRQPEIRNRYLVKFKHIKG